MDGYNEWKSNEVWNGLPLNSAGVFSVVGFCSTIQIHKLWVVKKSRNEGRMKDLQQPWRKIIFFLAWEATSNRWTWCFHPNITYSLYHWKDFPCFLPCFALRILRFVVVVVIVVNTSCGRPFPMKKVNTMNTPMKLKWKRKAHYYLFTHTFRHSMKRRQHQQQKENEPQNENPDCNKKKETPKEKSRPIVQPTMEWKHDKQTHVYWFSHIPPDSGAIVIALNFYQSFIYGNGALNMQISSFDSMIFVSQIKPTPICPFSHVNLRNLQLAINSLLFRRSQKRFKTAFIFTSLFFLFLFFCLEWENVIEKHCHGKRMLDGGAWGWCRDRTTTHPKGNVESN